MSRKYNVEFCFEDDFPSVVMKTDDLSAALDAADRFEQPEGWDWGDEGEGCVTVMSVIDVARNMCVYWTDTDGERGSDAPNDYPGIELIDQHLRGY